ncbi:MAG: hypothetical protein KH365_04615 [Clostridiales bacterium]|nr:hypothetical protein [Clostridiales bacterium]
MYERFLQRSSKANRPARWAGNFWDTLYPHPTAGGVKNALFYSPSKMSVGGLSVFEAPLVGQILYLVKIQENFAASRRRCEKAQAEFFPPPLFISIFFTNTHFCKNYGIMV